MRTKIEQREVIKGDRLSVAHSSGTTFYYVVKRVYPEMLLCWEYTGRREDIHLKNCPLVLMDRARLLAPTKLY